MHAVGQFPVSMARDTQSASHLPLAISPHSTPCANKALPDIACVCRGRNVAATVSLLYSLALRECALPDGGVQSWCVRAFRQHHDADDSSMCILVALFCLRVSMWAAIHPDLVLDTSEAAWRQAILARRPRLKKFRIGGPVLATTETIFFFAEFCNGFQCIKPHV